MRTCGPARSTCPSVFHARWAEASTTPLAPRIHLPEHESMTSQTETNKSPTMRRRRWVLLSILAGVFLVAGSAYGAYWATVLRYRQTTDDAYVNGNVVQITPQISGTVIAIGADDTQFVKAGQPLVQLDQADAKVALDQAEAQLAKTVREVRNLFATSAQLRATVAMRQSDLALAQKDLARRERL